MRRYIPTVLTLTCTLVFSCSEPPKPQKAKNLDKIEAKDSDKKKKESNALPELPKDWVAKVNDTKITTPTFSAIYDLKVAKYKERGRDIPKTADRRYRKSIAERLILQEIMRQEAQSQGVTLDSKALSDKMESQKNGISDWDKHLSRRGESEASLREIYTRELLEQALLAKAGKLEVSEEEVDQEYEKAKPSYVKDQERVQASHILIRVGNGDDSKQASNHAHDAASKPGTESVAGKKPAEPSDSQKKQWEKEALAKAKEIQKLAKAKGADFAALAQEKSEGPSAAKGGKLGIFTADRMVKEFSDAAFALKVGQVSNPVHTKFGYHIIKVTGKYPPGDLPKEALADQLRERLEARKLIEGKRQLKDELLAKYKVENRIADALGVDSQPKPSSSKSKIRPAPKVAKAEPKDAKAGDKPASSDPQAKPSSKPNIEKRSPSPANQPENESKEASHKEVGAKPSSPGKQ